MSPDRASKLAKTRAENEALRQGIEKIEAVMGKAFK